VKTEVAKKLSANDVGDTGAHQAGILVPKNPKVLSFFPRLEPSSRNPRQVLTIRELTSRERWEFHFIYYNNKLHGAGTRNEYRLTHMTAFLRAISAKAGDELRFSRDEDMSYLVRLVRASDVDVAAPTGSSAFHDDPNVLVLSSGWKVINF